MENSRSLYQWFPISASGDLPYRHVFQAQLLGQEMAVWRADDDNVNAWENRCLHRGVRLSIGVNDGAELKCQYHGWRYSNRTGGCTYIPAHPVDSPARTICSKTFPVVERYGLVWSGISPEGKVPEIEELEGNESLVLRGLPVNAPANVLANHLIKYHFQPAAKTNAKGANILVEPLHDLAWRVTANQEDETAQVYLFVQPVDPNRSVIRAVLRDSAAEQNRIAILQHHNEQLGKVRDAAEAFALSHPSEAQNRLQIIPALDVPTNMAATFQVTVAKKWKAAEDIAGCRLEATEGQLPTAQPGAHIDVNMPNGLVRQYSITNGPGETDHYTIGVKLETPSKGGSECMHRDVKAGSQLTISAPRNNFPLRRDAIKTIFLAGGIGITPLLSMSRTLHRGNLPFELHYFSQSDEHIAFPDLIDQMGESVHKHLGLSPEQTTDRFQDILANWQPETHLYVCGPGPMLEAARTIAEESGWPEQFIHFEYFKNTNEIDDRSSFEIALARSDLTLSVPGGKTIIEVLRENGLSVPTSCEQGACGTCKTTVLEGTPDHQDVYLSKSERKSGNCMMTCVSRAKSARLVLDI